MRKLRPYQQEIVRFAGRDYIVRRLPKGAVIFNIAGRYLTRVYKVSQIRTWLRHFAEVENRNGNATG